MRGGGGQAVAGAAAGFRVDDYYLRRAGLDYWEHLAWQVVDDWEALTAALAGRRRWFFTKKAERSYLDAAYEPGDVLVFGSESAGLPDHTLGNQPQTRNLRIPTRTEVRSLNLSNAVAVAPTKHCGNGRAGGTSPVAILTG